jgi:hypothetical protein
MATGRKGKTKATAVERKPDSLRWSTSPMRHVPGFIQSTKKIFISGIGSSIGPNSRTEQTQLPRRNPRIVRRDPPMKKGLPSGSP